MMLENSLFYILFLSQLFIVSIYFAGKIAGRMRYIFEHFPPEQYPCLYPGNSATLSHQANRFEFVNRAIFCSGLLLLAGCVYWDINNQGYISEMIPVVFLMWQMTPIMLLEYREKEYFSQMRKADLRTKRSSGLVPRRLFDFVSPLLILIALGAVILAIVVDIAVNQHIETFALGLGKGTLMRTILIIVCNIVFAVIIYYNLHGKRHDPHQDEKDRLVVMETTIKSLVQVSIAMSIFFAIREGTDDMGVDYLQASMMSLYCVIVAFMSIGSKISNIKIEQLNFDVYKKQAKT